MSWARVLYRLSICIEEIAHISRNLWSWKPSAQFPRFEEANLLSITVVKVRNHVGSLMYTLVGSSIKRLLYVLYNLVCSTSRLEVIHSSSGHKSFSRWGMPITADSKATRKNRAYRQGSCHRHPRKPIDLVAHTSSSVEWRVIERKIPSNRCCFTWGLEVMEVCFIFLLGLMFWG